LSELIANLLFLTGGFGALYFGAEWLVRGSVRIASEMGVSPVVVGLTLVSLGTSAPELVVCIQAALDGAGNLAAGNVLGSNLANIGLILGATALLRPVAVADRVIAREVPIMILITVMIFPFVMDGGVSRGDGVVLLVLLTVYLAITFVSTEEDAADILDEVGLARDGDHQEHATSRIGNLALVAAGAIGLGLGGRAIITGATYLVDSLGASEMVIGATVIAIGTSLPELVTSLVAAARKHADVAVGNIIGSNIFNLTAVMGGSALVQGFDIEGTVLTTELPAVLLLSLLVWPVAASAREVRRSEGLLLLLAYAGCMVWIGLAH